MKEKVSLDLNALGRLARQTEESRRRERLAASPAGRRRMYHPEVRREENDPGRHP